MPKLTETKDKNPPWSFIDASKAELERTKRNAALRHEVEEAQENTLTSTDNLSELEPDIAGFITPRSGP